MLLITIPFNLRFYSKYSMKVITLLPVALGDQQLSETKLVIKTMIVVIKIALL